MACSRFDISSLAFVTRASSGRFEMRGTRTAESIPSMTMTTMSSSRVNASSLIRVDFSVVP